MLFSSTVFLAFFAGYFALHLLLPLPWRLPLIIAGSAVFYAWWNVWYAWIPFVYILIAHRGTLWMTTAREASRRLRLGCVIAALLAPLLVVKYLAFVHNDILRPLLGLDGHLQPWPLPLGISFITFTLIAYVVDVHRGRYPVEADAGLLSGLVLFFPHLIAGPILRPGELLPQLRQQRRGLPPAALFAVALFTWGLVKKLVFADSFAEAVDRVYAPGAGAALLGPDYLLAFYGFALQIYCDFSGYTDMAIAIALLLGVRLPINFRRPYGAPSIVVFWRRWHITLSRWLRDYLYIPLGGNRRGRLRQTANLVITMGLGGLWHGANWTFLLWGLAHGAAIGAAHGLRRVPGSGMLLRLPHWVGVLLTFHLVAALWILFRAPNLSTARRVAAGTFTAPWHGLDGFATTNAFALGLLVLFFVVHRWDSQAALRRCVRKTPRAVLLPALASAWILSIAVSQGSSAKFIYFDF